MSRQSPGSVLAAIVSLIALCLTCSARAAADGKPADGKSLGSDPFQVPEGTIEDLQKYIEGLSQLHPSSEFPQAVVELHKKRAAAQLATNEKILSAKPTPDQARAAVRSKLAALKVLGRLGEASALAGLDATVTQVERLDLKDLVRDVQFAALDLRCERASTLGDNDIGRLVDRLKTYINESPPDGAPARLAVSLGMAAEESERPALAISIYRDFGNLLAPTKDNTIAGISLSLLGAARRLELVGKPFSLQGSTVANKPLDWKRYRGKVVLVDFFATWCGPCREEVPHILDCYKANRKRGFEVIAISIDRDRKPIEDYVEKEKLPWTILLDRNEARGTDKSLVTYYGIFAIPQMILVGKDGKVAALNVRGEQLKKKVDELLSTTESKATKS